MTHARWAEDLDALSAGEVIDRVLAEQTGAVCFTCSFQAEDMVVLHLLRQRLPRIPVLFLDTGYHFAETYAYRDRMAREWDLNLVNVIPKKSVAEQESEFGILNRSDPGRCCQLRKVEPLFQALHEFDVWFTGLRREQSPTRRNLKVGEIHELPDGKILRKVSPLASWDWEKVWTYTSQHRIVPLPLYDAGYRSIGCQPCTSVPADGADARSGRWGGTKLECGIHTGSRRGG
ncbi:MAG: phosphoadenylyl-sulfate reductase [Candidatus Acidiferrales bacterium]